MSGLLSYSGLTTKIRAMQSHLLNDQNFREIVELESVPQAVSYLSLIHISTAPSLQRSEA